MPAASNMRFPMQDLPSSKTIPSVTSRRCAYRTDEDDDCTDIRSGLAPTGIRVAPTIEESGILVESFSALPSQPSRQHHAFQQRRRGVRGLAELLEHDVGDVVGGVEAD